MTQTIVKTGDFIATSGLYKLIGNELRYAVFVYGDSVPTFKGERVSFQLVRHGDSVKELPTW